MNNSNNNPKYAVNYIISLLEAWPESATTYFETLDEAKEFAESQKDRQCFNYMAEIIEFNNNPNEEEY